MPELEPLSTPEPEETRDGYWMLSPESVEDLKLFMLRCKKYPATAKWVLEQNDLIWGVILRSALDAQRAQLGAEAIINAKDDGWPLWQVAIVAGAFLVVGAAVGSVAAWVGSIGG